MTITVEAVLQVAQIGILTGIFYRMGQHGAEIRNMRDRVERMEEATCSNH